MAGDEAPLAGTELTEAISAAMVGHVVVCIPEDVHGTIEHLTGWSSRAFAELYDRHSVLALRIARAICRDRSRAEDAVQEGFLAIWRYRAGARPATRSSLRHLPDAQAEVIVLAFYGELSHSEIATQLNLPTGTVKGRMRLGLEKLRREMDVPGQERWKPV